MEDVRGKILQAGIMNSVSKSISSKYGPAEGWLKAGPTTPPTVAPNTGFFFCPEFKLTYNSNGPTDTSYFSYEVTMIVETRGQRFMNTV